MATSGDDRKDRNEGRLSGEEATELSRQIADLALAGLPLASGLRAAAAESPSRRMKSALGSIATRIDQGGTVEEAITALHGRIPGHLAAIVQVGSRSGHLGRVLGRFTEFADVVSDLRWKLWICLVTPAVSITLAVLILTFVSVVLVGSFEEIYRDFGVPLPRLTIALIMLSRPFQQLPRLFPEGLIVVAVLYAAFRFLLDAATRRALVGQIPLIGSASWNTSLAEFCHLLAMLLESEVPLPEAVRLAGLGVEDASFHRAGASMSREVSAGTPLSMAVGKQRAFPKGVGRLLAWAESAQGLPQALRMAAEMFEARARSLAEFVGVFMSVLAVLLTLMMVILVIIGLFLPMLQLISALSG